MSWISSAAGRRDSAFRHHRSPRALLHPSPRPFMFTYILLALIAGLLTGMLIAWYRRNN